MRGDERAEELEAALVESERVVHELRLQLNDRRDFGTSHSETLAPSDLNPSPSARHRRPILESVKEEEIILSEESTCDACSQLNDPREHDSVIDASWQFSSPKVECRPLGHAPPKRMPVLVPVDVQVQQPGHGSMAPTTIAGPMAAHPFSRTAMPSGRATLPAPQTPRASPRVQQRTPPGVTRLSLPGNPAMFRCCASPRQTQAAE